MTEGVLLIDFGSALEVHSVDKYLKSIFSDPHIVGAEKHPKLRRTIAWAAAKGLESRVKDRAERIKDKIHPVRARDGLAQSLSEKLGCPVAWATRYASRDIESGLLELNQKGCQKIVVIPLFPQQSWSVTESIRAKCMEAVVDGRIKDCEIVFIGSWLWAESFVRVWKGAIQREIEGAGGGRDMHLVFSAHAVPLKNEEKRGCPYLREVERAAKLIHDDLDRKLPMQIAYQSKGWWGRWSSPSLDKTLIHLLKQGVRSCLVIPISFIVENVETLIDLDEAIIPRFRRLGMAGLRRVQTPGNSQEVINTLAELVQN
jgi:ferrochelatase